MQSSLTTQKAIAHLTRTQFATPVVRIDFIDHGPGLSEQDRARVFQPFYTKKAKGMGLGLSIVKGIIEAHGGAILEIGNEDEQGAHFVVLLPTLSGKERRPRQVDGSPAQVFGGSG